MDWTQISFLESYTCESAVSLDYKELGTEMVSIVKEPLGPQFSTDKK